MYACGVYDDRYRDREYNFTTDYGTFLLGEMQWLSAKERFKLASINWNTHTNTNKNERTHVLPIVQESERNQNGIQDDILISPTLWETLMWISHTQLQTNTWCGENQWESLWDLIWIGSKPYLCACECLQQNIWAATMVPSCEMCFEKKIINKIKLNEYHRILTVVENPTQTHAHIYHAQVLDTKTQVVLKNI